MLGQGTFGEVILGEWLGTPVAIKTIQAPSALPPAVMGGAPLAKGSGKEEFHTELELLSELSHPKLVRFLGASLTPPAIVLEHYPLPPTEV